MAPARPRVGGRSDAAVPTTPPSSSTSDSREMTSAARAVATRVRVRATRRATSAREMTLVTRLPMPRRSAVSSDTPGSSRTSAVIALASRYAVRALSGRPRPASGGGSPPSWDPVSWLDRRRAVAVAAGCLGPLVGAEVRHQVATAGCHPSLGDEPVERRHRGAGEGRQERDGVPVLRHLEDLALLDPVEVDRQVLAQLPHADSGRPGRGLAHVAHRSTARGGARRHGPGRSLRVAAGPAPARGTTAARRGSRT